MENFQFIASRISEVKSVAIRYSFKLPEDLEVFEYSHSGLSKLLDF